MGRGFARECLLPRANMSFTEHEVGSVPSATTTNSEPKHLNDLPVAVISFLVPPAGLIMAVRLGGQDFVCRQ
jgi:hypothetical protein